MPCGFDTGEDLTHCVVHHGRVAQDEAFEVSGDGEQGGLEVCLALRQGIRRRLRVVHGVAEVGEQPGHGDEVEVGEDLLLHAAFGSAVEVLQFEAEL